MTDYQEALSRFQAVTDTISPSSVTFSDEGVPVEMYDEEAIIKILEELNPKMVELIRDYGLSKTLGVLNRLELLARMKTIQVK